MTDPPGPSREQFGHYLQRLRAEVELSIPEFAGLCGVEANRIVMIEAGYASPNLDELEAFAGALEIPLSVIFRKWESLN